MTIALKSSLMRHIVTRFRAASVFLALGCLLLFCGCESLSQRFGKSAPEEPSPQILIQRLTSAGLELRKIDIIDMEGTAGLASGQRSRYQAKLQGLAEAYALKYSIDLQRLSNLPRKEVDAALERAGAHNALLGVGTTGDPKLSRQRAELEGVAKIVDTIKLHLRMARAKVSPSQADIIRDYRNLRYQDPPPLLYGTSPKYLHAN